LAHQLRQPLAVIGAEVGNIESHLRKKDILDDFTQEAIRAIKSSVTDINDHITLMRDRARASEAPPIEFDLCEWLQETVNTFKRSVKLGVSVDLEPCDEKLTVRFSREALRFVIKNFLQNAAAAVAPIENRERKISVSVSKSKETVYRVTVTDTGNGVPEDFQDRLMKEAVPSQTGGSGWGLVYSRDVIEDSKGSMDFENLEPFGAAFYIEFKNREVPDE